MHVKNLFENQNFSTTWTVFIYLFAQLKFKKETPSECEYGFSQYLHF